MPYNNYNNKYKNNNNSNNKSNNSSSSPRARTTKNVAIRNSSFYNSNIATTLSPTVSLQNGTDKHVNAAANQVAIGKYTANKNALYSSCAPASPHQQAYRKQHSCLGLNDDLAMTTIGKTPQSTSAKSDQYLASNNKASPQHHYHKRPIQVYRPKAKVESDFSIPPALLQSPSDAAATANNTLHHCAASTAVDSVPNATNSPLSFSDENSSTANVASIAADTCKQTVVLTSPPSSPTFIANKVPSRSQNDSLSPSSDQLCSALPDLKTPLEGSHVFFPCLNFLISSHGGIKCDFADDSRNVFMSFIKEVTELSNYCTMTSQQTSSSSLSIDCYVEKRLKSSVETLKVTNESVKKDHPIGSLLRFSFFQFIARAVVLAKHERAAELRRRELLAKRAKAINLAKHERELQKAGSLQQAISSDSGKVVASSKLLAVSTTRPASTVVINNTSEKNSRLALGECDINLPLLKSVATDQFFQYSAQVKNVETAVAKLVTDFDEVGATFKHFDYCYFDSLLQSVDVGFRLQTAHERPKLLTNCVKLEEEANNNQHANAQVDNNNDAFDSFEDALIGDRDYDECGNDAFEDHLRIAYDDESYEPSPYTPGQLTHAIGHVYEGDGADIVHYHDYGAYYSHEQFASLANYFHLQFNPSYAYYGYYYPEHHAGFAHESMALAHNYSATEAL